MESLVAKLLVPFAVLLGLSALGIAILALSARRPANASEEYEEAPFERPAAPPSGGAPRRGRFVGDEREAPHQTLVIDRRSAREPIVPSGPRPRGPHDLRGPDTDAQAPPRGPSPGMARPAAPQRPPSPAEPPRRGAETRDDSGPRPPSGAGVRPFDLVDRSGRGASSLPWERDDSPPPRPREEAEPPRGAGSPVPPRTTGPISSVRPPAGAPPTRPPAGLPPDEAPRPRPQTHETNMLRNVSPDSTVRATRPDSGPPTVPPARRDIFDSTRPQGRPSSPPSGPGPARPTPPRETRSIASSDGTAEMRAVSASDAAKGRDSGGLGRGREGGEAKFEPSGVNIVLQQPINARAFASLPGRLEVVYGNFSPQDPREIPLLWAVGDNTTPRFVFSKSPGDTIGHIQLNHYTITSGAQADLTFENGRHTLGNLVAGDEMDRYQIRVNGVPMGLGERLVLHSGDIISMGIYRLKLTI